MRIGIDARELCGHATGVGRYLAGLLDEWSVDERARRHEFVLYAPEPVGVALDAHRFATRTIPGPGDTWWEQVKVRAVASRDHLDVWFSPAYSLPLLLNVPAVVTIHDVSFVAHPEWFHVREGIRRRLLCRRSAARARQVITISEFTRRELVERLHVPDEKIHVIAPGVRSPRPATGAPAPSAPVVLFVGSIFNRRHLPDLIRAFAPLARAHADARLEIVGDNRTHPHEDLPRAIARQGLTARVHWHQYVTDDRLRELYRQARAFAFLSEYEGLGLTPLEALACSVPPVLLDTPVARESCGDAALYVPRGNIAAITRALDAALFSTDVRRRVLTAAPATLARYQWPCAAAQTLALLEKTAA